MRENYDRCKRCHAMIQWVRTPAGKMMPIDCHLYTDGNVLIDGNIARVVPKEKRGDYRMLRKCHFATCPNSDSFRRKKEDIE